MYQVTKREKGQCLFNCPGEEIVSVTKAGEQPVKVCKRHLWDILANGQRKAKKKAETK
jgi:hypothetical protein